MSAFDWKVLHVKPRCEKKLVTWCTNLHVPCYLPLRQKKRIVQRRKVFVELPLFPGYVFAEFRMEMHKLSILQSQHVVRIIDPGHNMRLAKELVMIRKALRLNPDVTPEPPLEKGCHVRIVSGPFMGIVGIVEQVKKKMRVILNVEMIGQSISVNANSDEVEVIQD